ncbi:MAG: GntR family transcriptional regulator [Lachnospiraceae bacterium]|nr:GntR family transcriptional regulator [Lachnospiraceae bacterium]
MVLLDSKDRRPIYEQLTEKLSDLMVAGVLKEEEPLPSVRNLAAELSINPNTVQRSYLELERRGFIYTVKGKGSFVSSHLEIREQKKTAIYDALEALIQQAIAIDISEAEFAGKVTAGFQNASQHAQREGSL